MYTAEALATGEGRNGHVRSSDSLIDADLALPKEMGGKGGATNPEQLFAAGYAACFHNALRLVAQNQTAFGKRHQHLGRCGISPNGTGGFRLRVALTAHLPGLDQDVADKFVAQAHEVCPYSNAARGNVEVDLTTVI